MIPADVLDAVQQEAREVPVEAYPDEPITAPQPAGDAPALLATEADPELALHALSNSALFRELPFEALEAMAAGAEQLEVAGGEYLFHEGDDADSFYVVVDGTLEVVRRKEGREVALRHLGCGEVVGLFGLAASQLRAASARAIGDSTVIQLRGERLQALLDDNDALHAQLLRFYRERLLEGFLSARLFADVDSVARARILGRFRHRELSRGEVLAQPGEVSNLLAVVTHGELVAEDRARPGQAPERTRAGPGQYVAVASALLGVPSRRRIAAGESASVALLTHQDLTELIRDYPALRALPGRLGKVATALGPGVFLGATGVPGL